MNEGKTSVEADKLFIEACRRGERSAQIRLYNLYSKAMFNTALRILGNRQEAEEAMHDGFLAAFQKFSTYDGKAVFGTWLKRIVVNKSIDQLRKRNRIIFEDLPSNITELSDEQDEFPDLIPLNPEQISVIMEKIHRQYRIVLSLHLFEGYSHEEIAGMLGMSYGAVRTCFSRARKALSDQVKQYIQSIMLN
jgi:RNA polymerase sigma-70 factor (ECF subfamily)